MSADVLVEIPKKIAAERQILGCCFQWGEAVTAATQALRSSSFYLDYHGLVFDVVWDLARRGLPVNVYVVGEELLARGQYDRLPGPSPSEWLRRLVDEAPTLAVLDYAMAQVRDAEDKRRYFLFLQQAQARFAKNGASAETIRAEWRRDLTDIGILAEPESAAATRFTRPLSAVLTAIDEPVGYLVERLVVAGANGWVGGEPKSFKSWLALYLAVCGSLGVPLFGRYVVPAPFRVLYLQEEDGERRVRRRVRKILRGLGAHVPSDELFRVSIKAGLLLDDERWLEALRGELDAFRPALVICDVFELMHTKDSNERAELKPILYRLDRLREQFGCGFLLVDHFRKSTLGASKRGGQRLSGSVGKHAWGESSVYLFPGLKKDQVRVETELKDGPSEAFSLTLEDTEDDGVQFRWEAEADERAAEMKAKVLEALVSVTVAGEWVTAKLVSEAAGVSVNTAVKWLNLLVDEDGKLERQRRQAGKVTPWHWRLRA